MTEQRSGERHRLVGVDLAIEEIRSHPEKFDADVSRACVELFDAGEIKL